MELSPETIESLYEKAITFTVAYGAQVIVAIVLLLIGMWLANRIAKLVTTLMQKKNIDVTLSIFTGGMMRTIILIFVAIIVLNQFGIYITPLVAALGAGALGLTLAIQGPISNYGAGICIIITRPFVVGNTLTVHGRCGIVQEVKLGTTQLQTEDNEQITIPNKLILGEILKNSYENHIIEGTVGIAYDANPDKAIEVISAVLQDTENVVQEPQPQIGIDNFGDSSIDIGYHYWVPTQELRKTRFEVNLAVYNALKAANIAIPFPQREVTIKNPSK